jgi:hypothetical protein
MLANKNIPARNIQPVGTFQQENFSQKEHSSKKHSVSTDISVGKFESKRTFQ